MCIESIDVENPCLQKLPCHHQTHLLDYTVLLSYQQLNAANAKKKNASLPKKNARNKNNEKKSNVKNERVPT
jgi:hypothetical protein